MAGAAEKMKMNVNVSAKDVETNSKLSMNYFELITLLNGR